MPIDRRFIDWNQPALPAAAELLLEGRRHGTVVDLQNLIVAVPGRGSGRRLLEILVNRADEDGLSLVPPEIVTVGQLPELLYEKKRPFADDLTQQLAWVQTLKETEPEELRGVIRDRPSDGDLAAWLALGRMLARLHRELASDALNFHDVAERGSGIEQFNEADRWRTLAGIQDRYLRLLDALDLWDLQTARLVAIEREECATEKDIVLVGTVDLNRAQRQMLDQVAERVTAYVFAPEDLRNRFDEHGCLISDAWQDVTVNLQEEQLQVVDRPGDQADAVVEALAGFEGRFAAEEITIGVPDERLVPYVQQRLEECEVSSRYGAGTPMTETSPGRLLAGIAEFLEGRSFRALADMVRHPAVERWLLENGVQDGWLNELDEYYAEHLPARVTGHWRSGKKSLRDAWSRLSRLLEDLSGSPRRLQEWGRPVTDLLVALFGGSPLDREDEGQRKILRGCEAVQTVLQEHAAIPEPVAPQVTAAQAIRLVLEKLSTETVPPPAEESAVELLGWLELPLDDAPALVVTGFNEGFVPSSKNSDLFLPNALRRHLDLEDNDRRYARDAYVLSLLTASRDRLHLIAGRRTADNDPLFPSRLLFSCGDGRLAERTRRLFAKPVPKARMRLPGRLRPGLRDRSAFQPPQPLHVEEPVTVMRVTEFREYLACPYRYYLRRCLKLQGVDFVAEELGPPAFGELLHGVLNDFAYEPQADSTNAEEIYDRLGKLLDKRVRDGYGKEPQPAVRVQVEQIRERLAAFARWQADWARQGWRIHKAEAAVDTGQSSFSVDDSPIYLVGRIDRLDVNEWEARWAVFDYKTGETDKDPGKAHRNGAGEWIDLQLPLYRHLVTAVEAFTDPFDLGYINIPKDVARTGARLAGWTEEDLAEADRTAEEVARNVRQEIFWPPKEAPGAFDEFAAICQTFRADDSG